MEILATALVLAFAFNFLQAHYLLITRALKSSQTGFYKQVFPSLITGIAIAIVLFFTEEVLERLNPGLFVSVAVKTVVTAIAFLISLFITGDLNLLRRVFSR